MRRDPIHVLLIEDDEVDATQVRIKTTIGREGARSRRRTTVSTPRLSGRLRSSSTASTSPLPR